MPQFHKQMKYAEAMQRPQEETTHILCLPFAKEI